MPDDKKPIAKPHVVPAAKPPEVARPQPQDNQREPVEDDQPARSAATPERAEPAPPPSRGAQVILTGEALTAARGGASSTVEGNKAAKEALEASGEVADGTSPDGSTRTGKPAADVVVTEEAKPSGTVPAVEK